MNGKVSSPWHNSSVSVSKEFYYSHGVDISWGWRCTHWYNTLRPTKRWLILNRQQFQMCFIEWKLSFLHKFCWSFFFLKDQLTIIQHWFMQWLGVEQVTSHYLNQWCRSSLTCKGITWALIQYKGVFLPVYRGSHSGDKMVVRLSYLHSGISQTGNMRSLYWMRAQASMRYITKVAQHGIICLEIYHGRSQIMDS